MPLTPPARSVAVPSIPPVLLHLVGFIVITRVISVIETISRDRLIDLLNAGADQRIAIIGDAMLDVYLRGDVDRISPEAPVPVVRVRDKELALGGAANVAQNVFAIGAHCDLVCAVGDDAEGQVIKAMLRDLDSDGRSVVTSLDGRRPRRASSPGRSRSFASTKRMTPTS